MKTLLFSCLIICLISKVQAQRNIFSHPDRFRYFYGKGVPSNEGQMEERHTIMVNDSAYDPFSNGEIKILPYGKKQVLKLGNENSGAQADRVTYTFRVTPQSALFVYQYAIILQDPNHPPSAQPKFEISIRDSTGTLLDPRCGYYKVVAGSGASSKRFQDGPSQTQYKDWTAEAINLSSYIGRNVVIDFTVYDCGQGGHFGYAYLDAYYGALEVKVEYCENDTVATLIAPEGFATYDWKPTGQRSRKIFVHEDDINQNYACKLTSVTGCTITLGAVIKPQKHTIQASADLQDATCHGKRNGKIKLKVDKGIQPYRFDWSDGIKTQTRTGLRAGNYRVVVTDYAGCKEELDLSINQPDRIPIKASVKNVSCFNLNNGKISLDPLNDNPYSVIWSNGQKGLEILNLAKGNYYYEFSSMGGCTWDSSIITEPLELNISGSIISNYNGSPISCNGEQDGILAWEVNNGVPPYQASANWINQSFRVSTSQDNLIFFQLPADTFRLEITDANQCIVSNQLILPEPNPISIHGELSSYNNYQIKCHGEKNGFIKTKISGGNAGYNYKWISQGRLISKAKNLDTIPAGTYSLHIIDSNGCSARRSFKLNEAEKLEIEKGHNIDFGLFIRSKFIIIGGAGSNIYYKNDQEIRKPIIWGKDRQRSSFSVTDQNGCNTKKEFKIKRIHKPHKDPWRHPCSGKPSLFRKWL